MSSVLWTGRRILRQLRAICTSRVSFPVTCVVARKADKLFPKIATKADNPPGPESKLVPILERCSIPKHPHHQWIQHRRRSQKRQSRFRPLQRLLQSLCGFESCEREYFAGIHGECTAGSLERRCCNFVVQHLLWWLCTSVRSSGVVLPRHFWQNVSCSDVPIWREYD